MATVLIIDDNESFREGVAAVVRKMGCTVALAPSGADGLVRFADRAVNLVITDLRMDGVDGMAVLDRVRALDEDAVVLLVTGFGSVHEAVDAMKRGAFDFLEKPLSPDALRRHVSAGLQLRDERRSRRAAAAPAALTEANPHERNAPAPPSSTEARQQASNLLGQSPGMRAVFSAIEKIGPTDTTVFIRGESGTGKELVARAIHERSARRDRPFVGVNCAAIPHSLLESELFGHERGAFTGAVKQKAGRFEQAHAGTLFLDEIGDVPIDMQAKLLRALQEKQIQRVGGEGPVSVDARIISATHRDIGQMVKEGTFREDLYFRLHIIPIELPPLRARVEDIELLARHLLEKLAPRTRAQVTALDESCLAVLRAYRWPGNVRELENVLEQALVFCDGHTLRASDLPPLLGSLMPARAPDELPPEEDGRTLDEILEGLEKALIERAYLRAHRVKTETARRLGIKTSALYYKLEKYKIE